MVESPHDPVALGLILEKRGVEGRGQNNPLVQRQNVRSVGRTAKSDDVRLNREMKIAQVGARKKRRAAKTQYRFARLKLPKGKLHQINASIVESTRISERQRLITKETGDLSQ